MPGYLPTLPNTPSRLNPSPNVPSVLPYSNIPQNSIHSLTDGGALPKWLGGLTKSLGSTLTNSLSGGFSSLVSGLVNKGVNKLLGNKSAEELAREQLKMQTDAQKDLYDYQLQGQLRYQEYFNQLDQERERTSYANKVAGMKQAGLNPASLNGGSFSTATPVSAGSIGTASQPDFSQAFIGLNSLMQNESQFGRDQSRQVALNNADIALKQAEVDKAKAETALTHQQEIEKQIENEFAAQEHKQNLEFKRLQMIGFGNMNDLYPYQKKELIKQIAKISMETDEIDATIQVLKEQKNKVHYEALREKIMAAWQNRLNDAQFQRDMNAAGLSLKQAQEIAEKLPYVAWSIIADNEYKDELTNGVKIKNGIDGIQWELDQGKLDAYHNESADTATKRWYNALALLTSLLKGIVSLSN